MTSPRTLLRLALAASLMLTVGCGGNNPDVDTAETIKTESAKPAPPPSPTPEAAPPQKEAPKG